MAGGSGRVGCAAVDPRSSAPPKLKVEGSSALDPGVLWVTQRREVGSDGLQEPPLGLPRPRNGPNPPGSRPTGASGAPAISALKAAEGAGRTGAQAMAIRSRPRRALDSRFKTVDEMGGRAKSLNV